jgi:hypothetical protein
VPAPAPTFFNGASSGASATTIGVASLAGQAVAIGELVIVRVGGATGVAATSVTDNATVGGTANVYTLLRGAATAGSQWCGLYYTIATRAIPALRTFTATWAASVTDRAIDVCWYPTPAASPADVSNTATFSATATAAAGAITPTAFEELAFYVEVDGGAASTATPAASWREDSDGATSASFHWETQSRNLGGLAALTPTATMSSASTGRAVGGTLKIQSWLRDQASFLGAQVTAGVAIRDTFGVTANAGDLLVVWIAMNENGGTSNVSTVIDSLGTSWAQVGTTTRSGTTNVALACFGKVAVGGETYVEVTASATTRVQTAFQNAGPPASGTWSLTPVHSNAANGTTSVSTGSPGSITPTAGNFVSGAVCAKNAEAFTTAPTVRASTVLNEGSTASTQKVSLQPYYLDAAPAVALNPATLWVGTTAPWAGAIYEFGTVSSVTTPQSATATASSAASLNLQVGRGLVASESPTATLVRLGALRLAAAEASSASVQRRAAKTIVATETSSATVAAQKVSLRTLSATASQAAALARQTSVRRAVTVASAATLGRLTQTRLAATEGTTATVAPVKVSLLSLAATAPSAATLARQALKRLTATEGTTATVASRLAFVRTLAATASSAASLARRTARTLAATEGTTATVAPVKVSLVTLSATAGSLASLLRRAQKPLAASAASSPSVTRRVGKGLPASAPTTASVARALTKTITATASSVASVAVRQARFQTLTASVSSLASLVIAKLSGAPIAIASLFSAGGEPMISSVGGDPHEGSAGGTPGISSSGGEPGLQSGGGAPTL